MKLTDVLSAEAIVVRSDASAKEDIFRAMIAAMAAAGRVTDADEVFRVVMERERMMSTGIGKGFALPHGKTNAVSDTAGAFLTLANPVDFQALDNQPVTCVFMLVGRENNVGTHLRLLSKISRLMNDENFRNDVNAATAKEEIYRLFEAQETDG